jgi:hypothetical protein
VIKIFKIGLDVCGNATDGDLKVANYLLVRGCDIVSISDAGIYFKCDDADIKDINDEIYKIIFK